MFLDIGLLDIDISLPSILIFQIESICSLNRITMVGSLCMMSCFLFFFMPINERFVSQTVPVRLLGENSEQHIQKMSSKRRL